jgi:hypothetical protein
MAGKTFLSVVIILASAAWAQAEMKTLQLKDGSSVTGDVSETAGGYLVKSKYGSREISKSDVVKIADVVSFLDEYKQKLAGIDAKSAEDHFKLADWAYNNNQPGVAEKEARQALEIDKEHSGAKKLLELLTAGTTAGDGGTGGTKDGATGQTSPPVKPGEIRLVNAADIDRIRLAELFDDENQLPIVFQNNVAKRFLESESGRDIASDPKALARFHVAQLGFKAVQMRDAVEGQPNAEDIKKDIVVKSDPRVVAKMRASVWPLVASRCGNRDCHGGAKLNGVVRLVNRGDEATSVAYTNFVLLDGTVNKSGDRLIDRNEPERSLLLQYGLPNTIPPQVGQSRHLKVKGWIPLYKNESAEAYRTALAWIRSLRKNAPATTLEYKAPDGVTLDFGGSTDGLLKGAEPLGGKSDDDGGSDKAPEAKPEKSPGTGGMAPDNGVGGGGNP